MSTSQDKPDSSTSPMPARYTTERNRRAAARIFVRATEAQGKEAPGWVKQIAQNP